MQAGKKGAILGVIDSKLTSTINEALGIQCSHIGVVPEVTPISIMFRKEYVQLLTQKKMTLQRIYGMFI